MDEDRSSLSLELLESFVEELDLHHTAAIG